MFVVFMVVVFLYKLTFVLHFLNNICVLKWVGGSRVCAKFVQNNEFTQSLST